MGKERKTAEILRKEFVLQGNVWDVQGGVYSIPNLSDDRRKAWGSVTVRELHYPCARIQSHTVRAVGKVTVLQECPCKQACHLGLLQRRLQYFFRDVGG